ncbi:MAG: DUF924 domain-containing protein [Rhodocyclaceae bacterium]|nr:DUF924 domain-containing protein [Rhodocyclaceae bacterium]
MATALPAQAQAVLDFWFLPAQAPDHNRPRAEWFRKDAAFDDAIRRQFGALVEEALAGRLPDWGDDADATLARILVLDQFTRNLFRASARAFAGDAAALALAERLVGSGRDKNLSPPRRWFAFMPFMHSESLLEQERSVALFAALRREAQEPAFDSAYDYALHHRDVVARFGRFPHRNAALGRASTAAEEAFLSQPGSSF